MLVTKRSFPAVWRSAAQPGPRDRMIFDRGFIREYGLVGAWVFNHDAPKDLSGHGKDATPVGSTVGAAAGKYGAGLQCSGVANSDRLDLGVITAAEPLSLSQGDKATVACRVRYDGTPGSVFPRIFDKSDGGSALNGWAVYRDSDDTMILHLSGNSKAKSTASPTAGEYQSWGITRDGATANVFLEGVDDTGFEDIGAGNFSSTTTNAAFGNWNHTTNRNWHGLIEYFYVFDQALPGSEIARIARQPYRFLVPEPSRRPIFLPQVAAANAGIFVGADAITKIYAGSAPVTRIYDGPDLIWGS